jgi:hypothetical protein
LPVRFLTAHFNKKNHNYKVYFRIFIMKDKLDETRGSFEQYIIAITNTFGTANINRKIHKTKKLFSTYYKS